MSALSVNNNFEDTHLSHHTSEKQMHQQLGGKQVLHGAQMMNKYGYEEHTLIREKAELNKSSPSFLLPLFQNESSSSIFHTEISLIFKTKDVRVQLISI